MVQQIQTKWKDWFAKNGFTLLLCLAFLSFLLITLFVVYFGDDYYYITFRDLSFSDYFQKLGDHYLQDNGRFLVHLFVTLFLKMPLPVWACLEAVFLTGICYFAASILAKEQEKRVSFLFSLFFFLVAGLSISITRQSVYWLTGSFNYVYPFFCFLAYWYCFLHLEQKRYWIGSIVFGLLASASVEQVGMMTFGLTLLLCLTKWEGWKQISSFCQKNKKQLFLLALTLVGVCTVLLAPSQFTRIGLEQEENQSLVGTILANGSFFVREYFLSPQILPYTLVFFITNLFGVFQKKTKKARILLFASIINLGSTLLTIYILPAYTLGSYIAIAITLISYLVLFGIWNYEIYHQWISPLTISLVLMVGSQLMMLISPVLGPRNLIFGFLLLAIAMGTVIQEVPWKYENGFTILLIILALFLNAKTSEGYQKTFQVEQQNLSLLAFYPQEVLQDKDQEITLYRFPDDNYGWSMPYLSTYHEYYFKQLYQIRASIVWATP